MTRKPSQPKKSPLWRAWRSLTRTSVKASEEMWAGRGVLHGTKPSRRTRVQGATGNLRQAAKASGYTSPDAPATKGRPAARRPAKEASTPREPNNVARTAWGTHSRTAWERTASPQEKAAAAKKELEQAHKQEKRIQQRNARIRRGRK